MKKLLCVIACLCIAVSLFGCSDKDGASSSPPASTADTTSSAPPAAETTKVDVVKITGDGVNVRSEANTDSEILDQVAEGKHFQLSPEGAGKDWYKIQYEGKDAYVSTQFSTLLQVEESQVATLLGTATADPEVSTDPEASAADPAGDSSDSSDDSSQSPVSSASSGVNAEDIRNQEDPQTKR